jgi:urate oxidase
MTETRQGARIVMGQNNYGKSDIRLVKVFRATERHEIKDVRVDVAQEGDFDAAHVTGDNTGLMATDTMRNTVYALARDRFTSSIEAFGVDLVRYFVEAAPRASRVRVRFTEHPWERIEVNGQPHDHSFVRGAGVRTATVEGDGSEFGVEAGIDDLIVLKTTRSGWEGYHRDRFTTLPETDDRILATVVKADWSYGGRTELDFDGVYSAVRQKILESFTDHYSPSVQNTLYRMGRAVLESFPEVEKIHFSLPNRHHILYDLGRFGIENEGEVFHADAEPYGLIEGWVVRGEDG